LTTKLPLLFIYHRMLHEKQKRAGLAGSITAHASGIS
jgi:hypothetical protein